MMYSFPKRTLQYKCQFLSHDSHSICRWTIQRRRISYISREMRLTWCSLGLIVICQGMDLEPTCFITILRHCNPFNSCYTNFTTDLNSPDRQAPNQAQPLFHGARIQGIETIACTSKVSIPHKMSLKWATSETKEFLVLFVSSSLG